MKIPMRLQYDIYGTSYTCLPFFNWEQSWLSFLNTHPISEVNDGGNMCYFELNYKCSLISYSNITKAFFIISIGFLLYRLL